MHEWALAESILSAALEEAQKGKLKVINEISVELGELQQIEQDIFEFALQEILQTQPKILKNAKVTIKNVPSTLTCTSCEHKWTFNSMKSTISEDESEAIHFIPETFFVHTRCPKCGSPDFKITSGRGVTISSIKGKR